MPIISGVSYYPAYLVKNLAINRSLPYQNFSNQWVMELEFATQRSKKGTLICKASIKGGNSRLPCLIENEGEGSGVSLGSLYREMEETEKIRRELDQTKKLLQQQQTLQQLQQQQQQQLYFNKPGTSASTASTTTTSSLLRPRNYLLVCWSCAVLKDQICQIEGFLPQNGMKFSACFPPPKNCAAAEIDSLYGKVGNQFYFRDRFQRLLPPAAEMSLGLAEFLRFAEKGVKSVRPNFDAAILMSKSARMTSALFAAVRRNDLKAEFRRLIAGVGHREDLSSVNAEGLYGELSGKLGCEPNYQNCFKSVIKPLDAPEIKVMLERKSGIEREAEFSPLKEFFIEELQKEVDDEDAGNGGIIAETADEMCGMLLNRGFEFEVMLTYSAADLELRMRTEMLGSCSKSPSRAEMDKMVKVTNLTKRFFAQHGKIPLKVLLEAARNSAQRRESASAKADNDDSDDYLWLKCSSQALTKAIESMPVSHFQGHFKLKLLSMNPMKAFFAVEFNSEFYADHLVKSLAFLGLSHFLVKDAFEGNNLETLIRTKVREKTGWSGDASLYGLSAEMITDALKRYFRRQPAPGSSKVNPAAGKKAAGNKAKKKKKNKKKRNKIKIKNKNASKKESE